MRGTVLELDSTVTQNFPRGDWALVHRLLLGEVDHQLHNQNKR
jgi:hypothetical protein